MSWPLVYKDGQQGKYHIIFGLEFGHLCSVFETMYVSALTVKLYHLWWPIKMLFWGCICKADTVILLTWNSARRQEHYLDWNCF